MNILKIIKDLPQDVPPALAISICTYGYTEDEARQIMVEGGDTDKADEWISKLRAAGCFGFVSSMNERCMGQQDPDRTMPFESKDLSAESLSNGEQMDGGSFLWQVLKEELITDENGFKHRIIALEQAVKNGTCIDFCGRKASDIFPFNVISDNFPWNGCKFVSTSILLLITSEDAWSKRKAVKSLSKSLGGFNIPSESVLKAIRWPYILSEAYAKASQNARANETCTALHIQVCDVEIMRNPCKRKGGTPVSRPGTFAHSCIITVSPAGVYLFHGYGPRGYTLLQHIQKHDSLYPLSLDDGANWVQRFEEFAADLSGIFTEKVNDAYAYCFNVDLVALGNMRIGSQFDAYVTVDDFIFDTDLVQKNISFLPKPDIGQKIPCSDGKKATSLKLPSKFIPDGGVKHYYAPVILRCGNCGMKNTTNNLACARCKKVYYCGKECQNKDWFARHKKVCKALAKAGI